MADRESTEYKTILRCFDKLVIAIKLDPQTILNDLVTAELLPPDTQADGQKLATDISYLVNIDKSNYDSVLKVFSKHDWSKQIVTRLKSTYDSLRNEASAGATLEITSECEKKMFESNEAQIRGRFSILLVKVRLGLEDRMVDVEELQQFLKGLFQEGDCIKGTTILEIFNAITDKRLWDYGHYSCVEALVSQYLCEMSSLMTDYKAHLSGYYTTTKLINYIKYANLPEYGDSTIDPEEADLQKYTTQHYRKLKVILKMDRRISELSLVYVRDLWHSFAEEFDLPSLTALLDKILTGSLEIMWLILPHIAEKIKMSVKYSGSFFRQHNIVYVSIDDQPIYDTKLILEDELESDSQNPYIHVPGSPVHEAYYHGQSSPYSPPYDDHSSPHSIACSPHSVSCSPISCTGANFEAGYIQPPPVDSLTSMASTGVSLSPITTIPLTTTTSLHFPTELDNQKSVYTTAPLPNFYPSISQPGARPQPQQLLRFNEPGFVPPHSAAMICTSVADSTGGEVPISIIDQSFPDTDSIAYYPVTPESPENRQAAYTCHDFAAMKPGLYLSSDAPVMCTPFSTHPKPTATAQKRKRPQTPAVQVDDTEIKDIPTSAQLWEFTLRVLKKPKYHYMVNWENKKEGLFCFHDAQAFAALWGKHRNRPNMTYDKVARNLRYYYKRDILNQVGGRLTYQFSKRLSKLYMSDE